MSSISYIRYQKCAVCRVALRNQNVGKTVRITEKSIEKIKSFFQNNDIQVNDFICFRCRIKSYTSGKTINFTIENNGQSTISNSSLSSTSQSITSIENNDDSSEDQLDQSEIKDEKRSIKKIEFYRAPVSKSHCFVCKKQNGLHQIKSESIISAYKNNALLIQKDTRSCKKNFDSNGHLYYEDFINIRKARILLEKSPVELIDLCLTKAEKLETQPNDTCGIFDKFKDIASLDETLCLKITGWNRKDFVRFSTYIKNVRDTAGRTKDQLVAIYRYWLMKGLDQTTLSLLKCNSSQQQISHYLSTIRKALNDDVVPLLLGADKGKDFFINHNTASVKILHSFKQNTLAIIADGTYTRLEKSSNNEFQYVSYSLQKSTNLIKPFILCCADGYFIDCYGPFTANNNDADILKYILATDEHLKELLEPAESIFFFLDRGK